MQRPRAPEVTLSTGKLRTYTRPSRAVISHPGHGTSKSFQKAREKLFTQTFTTALKYGHTKKSL